MRDGEWMCIRCREWDFWVSEKNVRDSALSRQVVNKNVITTPLKIKKINIIKGYTTNNNIPFFDPDRGGDRSKRNG